MGDSISYIVVKRPMCTVYTAKGIVWRLCYIVLRIMAHCITVAMLSVLLQLADTHMPPTDLQGFYIVDTAFDNHINVVDATTTSRPSVTTRYISYSTDIVCSASLSLMIGSSLLSLLSILLIVGHQIQAQTSTGGTTSSTTCNRSTNYTISDFTLYRPAADNPRPITAYLSITENSYPNITYRCFNDIYPPIAANDFIYIRCTNNGNGCLIRASWKFRTQTLYIGRWLWNEVSCIKE
jgi:hypothetical protein